MGSMAPLRPTKPLRQDSATPTRNISCAAFSMTQRSRTRSSGNTYLEVIGSEDAGWAEEADQSKSLTGFRSGIDQQSLVIGKETRFLGRATELGFTLR
jgi:hypothetical protein